MCFLASHHIYQHREFIAGSERPDRADEIKGVADYSKNLGTNFESSHRHLHRNMMLSRARRDFAAGNLMAAWRSLESNFGVQQILDRTKCCYEGCNAILEISDGKCACVGGCNGFYCFEHRLTEVHDCKRMKPIIAQRVLDNKTKAREGDAPAEEKFDSAADKHLMMKVQDLAGAITGARTEKNRQRRSLRKLESSLKEFGAVRLLERPFKSRMCEIAMRHRQFKGGSKAPIFASHSLSASCDCSDAHSPRELRFKAGESASRRDTWVKESIALTEKTQETLSVKALSWKTAREREREREKYTAPTRRSILLSLSLSLSLVWWAARSALSPSRGAHCDRSLYPGSVPDLINSGARIQLKPGVWPAAPVAISETSKCPRLKHACPRQSGL